VQANGVAGRNNSTGDDVVAVDQGAGDRLTDAVDVDGGAAMNATMKQVVAASRRDHQNTEPTHIEAVVGAGDPLAELVPRRSALALLEGGRHEYGKEVPCANAWRLGKDRSVTRPAIVNVTDVCATLRRVNAFSGFPAPKSC
jgi:hypothetical protein